MPSFAHALFYLVKALFINIFVEKKNDEDCFLKNIESYLVKDFIKTERQ